jgi:hypothetical protein
MFISLFNRSAYIAKKPVLAAPVNPLFFGEIKLVASTDFIVIIAKSARIRILGK